MRALNSSFVIITFLIGFYVTSYGQSKDGSKLPPKLKISEKKSITITGNIKDYAPSQGLLDEYALRYSDLVTGESVIIPLSKDTAGNFSVTFQANGYQEIQLSRGFKVGNRTSFDGVFVGRFFVKPGEDMTLDYKRLKNFSSDYLFTGNLANANNQQDSYFKSINNELNNTDLISFSALDSIKGGDYIAIKRQIRKKLQELLDFNTRFFMKSTADPFLKEQMDLQYRYTAAHLLLLTLLKSQEKEPGLEKMLDSIGAPLTNAEAAGNDSYNMFLNTYYLYLKRETFAKEPTVTVLFTDMARYLLKEHNEFDEAERNLFYKILDTVNKPAPAEMERFTEYYMGKFDGEYLETIKTKMTFEQIASLPNPFLRDIYLTRLLRKRLDISQLVNINSLIPKYKKLVRESPVKSDFLKEYEFAYDRLYKSKLSSKSILNDSKTLPEGLMVKHILEKYKGKVIYLDIWATWCVPCLSQMSNSKKLRQQLAGKEVVFLYLCISSATESNWKNLIAGHNIEGEHYFLSNSQSAELAREFNIKFIPRYVIIDKGGNIANAEAGYPLDPRTRLEIEKL